MEKGYILTNLARKHGYLGTLKSSEIDDAVRSTFTVLQGENVPSTVGCISDCIRFSRWSIQDALHKLVRAGLVKELE